MGGYRYPYARRLPDFPPTRAGTHNMTSEGREANRRDTLTSKDATRRLFASVDAWNRASPNLAAEDWDAEMQRWRERLHSRCNGDDIRCPWCEEFDEARSRGT